MGRRNIKIRGFSLSDVAYLGLHIRNIFHAWAYTHHKTQGKTLA
jgi:hypothetical protein